MPVTERSCASGPREQKPEALNVGGYSSNGNVHENYIQLEMLSSIQHFISDAVIAVFVSTAGMLPLDELDG
jgi:hypothetical protein